MRFEPVSDDEVCPGDSHVRRQELRPQDVPRLARQLIDGSLARQHVLAPERVRDLVLALVHCQFSWSGIASAACLDQSTQAQAEFEAGAPL